MFHRRRAVIAGLIALFIGFCVYLLFREETYIAKFFEPSLKLKYIRQLLLYEPNDFVKYYLTDFLWAFSLYCFVSIIYSEHKYSRLISATLTFASGFIWEILQFIGTVSGTGDVLDVATYLFACILASIIVKE